MNRHFNSLQWSPERELKYSQKGSRINLSAIHSGKNISIPAIRPIGRFSQLEKKVPKYDLSHRRGLTSGNLVHYSSSKGREKQFKHPRIWFSNKKLDKKLKAFCFTQKKSKSYKVELFPQTFKFYNSYEFYQSLVAYFEFFLKYSSFSGNKIQIKMENKIYFLLLAEILNLVAKI